MHFYAPNRKLLLLALTLSLSYASALQVKRVSASQTAFLVEVGERNTLKLQDWICVVRNKKAVACGKLTKFTKDGAIIAIKFKREVIVEGDTATKINRVPASLANYSTLSTKSPKPKLELAGGLVTGISSVIPNLKLEYAVLDHLSVGFMPSYFGGSISSGVSFKTLGLAITSAYYQNSDFSGLIVEGGVGIYNFFSSSGSFSSTDSSFGGFLAGGYQMRFSGTFIVNGLVGAQYIPLPDVLDRIFEYSSFQPTLKFSVGLLF